MSTGDDKAQTMNNRDNARAKHLTAPIELRPLNQSLRQTGMCRFLPVNVSLVPLKNDRVAGTKYRLKQRFV